MIGSDIVAVRNRPDPFWIFEGYWREREAELSALRWREGLKNLQAAEYGTGQPASWLFPERDLLQDCLASVRQGVIRAGQSGAEALRERSDALGMLASRMGCIARPRTPDPSNHRALVPALAPG